MEAISYDRSWYEKYASGTSLDEAKKYLEYAAAMALIKDFPHSGKSLDIGTATGRYMLACQRLGYQAHGIDISTEAVAITRTQLRHARLDENLVQQMDASALNFQDHLFRLVTCMMGTFTHFRDQPAALAEIERVLLPGGRVLLSNWQPADSRTDFLSVNTEEHNHYLSTHSPKLDKLVQLLSTIGLYPEKYAYAVFLPTSNLQQIIDASYGEPAGHLDRLALLEQQIRELFPRLRGQILLLLARKHV